MKDHVEGCKLADEITTGLIRDFKFYKDIGEPVPPALYNAGTGWCKFNGLSVDNREGTNVNQLNKDIINLPFTENEEEQQAAGA